MIKIAKHLKMEALNKSQQGEKAKNEAELFAKSAINRYYYAMYLLIRKTIREESEGAHDPRQHNGLEDHLQTAIKRLEHIRRMNRRMKDPNFTKTINKAISVTKSLKDLVPTARHIRNNADYVPDSEISFMRNSFAINNVDVIVAPGWYATAITWRELILALPMKVYI